jgi:hypothetical protein
VKMRSRPFTLNSPSFVNLRTISHSGDETRHPKFCDADRNWYTVPVSHPSGSLTAS